MFIYSIIIGLMLSGGVHPYTLDDVGLIETIGIWYADMEMGYETDHLYANGGIEVNSLQIGIAEFWPTQASFLIDGGVKVDNLRIGIKFICFHPIIPYAPILAKFDYQIVPEYEGGYTAIYLEYSN